MKKQEKPTHYIWGAICFIVGMIIIIYSFNLSEGWSYKIKASLDSDKYWVKTYASNISSSHNGFELRSYSQDKINDEKVKKEYNKRIEEERLKQECYNNGKDYNFYFEIKEDYGYNCNKLKYINDHLIDSTKKLKSGEYTYRGFFSSGSGTQYQYVTERISASPDMIRSIKYHIDCNGNKLNEEIKYYTEGDAVMYYVDNCII